MVSACDRKRIKGDAESHDEPVDASQKVAGSESGLRELADEPRAECPDEVSHSIYVLASFVGDPFERSEILLMRFRPSTNVVERIAPIACTEPVDVGCFSMAVDRTGTAFALPLRSANPLFQIDTSTGACRALGSVFGEREVWAMYAGLTFLKDGGERHERLYATVLDPTLHYRSPKRLLRIEPMALRFAEEVELPYDGEVRLTPALAGTSSGDLFAMYLGTADVLRIDNNTGREQKKWTIPAPAQRSSAFAVFAGAIYIFVPYGGMPALKLIERIHRGDADSIEPFGVQEIDRARCPEAKTWHECTGTAIMRFSPKERSLVEVATINRYHVRAVSASTCVPAE
jgi:hypothetical protein